MLSCLHFEIYVLLMLESQTSWGGGIRGIYCFRWVPNYYNLDKNFCWKFSAHQRGEYRPKNFDGSGIEPQAWSLGSFHWSNFSLILFQEPLDSFNLEEMAGNVTLQANNRLQDVQVKVYRTSGEHFAVIYPQKKVCRPLGVINLKNTQVERRADGFTVRQCGADTPMCALSFRADPAQLDQWVRAFSSRTQPCSMSLQTPPILEEEEEGWSIAAQANFFVSTSVLRGTGCDAYICEVTVLRIFLLVVRGWTPV